MARPIKTKKELEEEKLLDLENKKRCSECKNVLDKSNFPIHNKKNNTLRSKCKDCYSKERKNRHIKNPEQRKKYQQKSYQKNKEKIVANNIKYYKNNKEKAKIWKNNFREKAKKEFDEFKKTLKCSICGYDKHPKAIDLHHIDPDNKKYLVSRLIYSRNKLKIELEKCIPICANCHRILHNKEN